MSRSSRRCTSQRTCTGPARWCSLHRCSRRSCCRSRRTPRGRRRLRARKPQGPSADTTRCPQQSPRSSTPRLPGSGVARWGYRHCSWPSASGNSSHPTEATISPAGKRRNPAQSSISCTASCCTSPQLGRQPRSAQARAQRRSGELQSSCSLRSASTLERLRLRMCGEAKTKALASSIPGEWFQPPGRMGSRMTEVRDTARRKARWSRTSGAQSCFPQRRSSTSSRGPRL